MLNKKHICIRTCSRAKQFLFNDSYPERSHFWSPEAGYPDRRGEAGLTTFPWWGRPMGFERGLALKVEQDLEEWQEVCSGGFSGFKVSQQWLGMPYSEPFRKISF